MIRECKTENSYQCFDSDKCILSIRKVDKNIFDIMNADGTFEGFANLLTTIKQKSTSVYIDHRTDQKHCIKNGSLGVNIFLRQRVLFENQKQ